MKRELVINGEKSCWSWPDIQLTNENRRELLGCAIEISIKFFFKHFCYNFGGLDYLQPNILSIT